MGDRRKGGSRGSVGRETTRSGAPRRGTRKTPRTGGRRSSGGHVVPLHDARRRTRRRAAGATRRGSSTGNTAWSTGRGRLRMVVVAFAVIGLLLGGRAVQMIVADDERFQAFAAEQGAGWAATGAAGEARGTVISADGRELATSLQAARVVATPYQIQDPPAAARRLEAVLGPEKGLDAADIEAKLTERAADGGPSGYSVVASGVGLEAVREITDLEIEGISIIPDTVRVYPEGALASQLMGHLGAYGEAFGGVEASFDEVLGRGEDVTLTVDTAVQRELEEALEFAVRKNDARGAVGLVMRVDDGAIVALANTPGYDNNRVDAAPLEDQRNRILTDPYEPGSTFKAITVASALEEGAVTEDTTFVVPDSIAVADRVIHDSRPHETEVMTTGDVLRESSNVGAIQIGQSLGGAKLEENIRGFGFGEKTGVDVWGEDPGIVPAYEDWSGSTIGNIPIGQGLTVTPLQLAAGYATIANGGRGITPHVAEKASPQTLGTRVISEETSAIVRGMLQGVVDDGSGHLAQIPGYTVAGKTGTSQKVDPETGTYGERYVASFVGFAPATDPEYVALIAVDEPERTYWGELAAAPAFRKVMSFALGYYNVPPDRSGTRETGP